MLKWKVNSPQLSAHSDPRLLRSISDADLCYSCSLIDSEESFVDSLGTNLREMMQDLQVGFSAAMNELSNIQDEDKILHEKMNSSKREHDTQMSDIVDLVQSLKAQCDNIQLQLAVSNKNQRKLERQIKKLKSERAVVFVGENEESHKLFSQLENINSNNTYTNNACAKNPMLKSYIASLPHPQDMEEIEDHHSDSDESLAAVTQRSLMLSNTLSQHTYTVPQSHSLGELNSTHMGDNSHTSSDLSVKSECNMAEGSQNLGNRKRLHNMATNRIQGHRHRLAVGIMESEKNYCTTLYNILEGYKKALSSSGGLTSRDLSRLFPPSLSSIYEYHCATLKKLETRLSRWRQQDILGDIFAKFSVTKEVDIFNQYREYIGNFPVALQTVGKLGKNSERFRHTLKMCQGEPGADNCSFVSQLLTPVRRISSIVLQIKKLLKYTDADHPDKFFLESSLGYFRSSLLTMNDSMERSLQLAVTDSSCSKRSLETSSWSSHEEEQRLSTATKDSGIHSNCDLGSTEELSSLSANPFGQMMVEERTGKSRVSSTRRPQSVIDFISPEKELTLSVPMRSKTPVPSSSSKSSRSLFVQHSSTPLKPSLSQSTPNLLEDNNFADGTMSLKRQQRRKHKVQFKNPPIEEQENCQPLSGSDMKKLKKRSLADTLKIIFNRRKGAHSKNSHSNMSDSCCDLTSSFEEGSHVVSSYLSENTDYNSKLKKGEATPCRNENTYEDENGDPYSVV